MGQDKSNLASANKHSSEAKQREQVSGLIHELYNSLAAQDDQQTVDIRDSLMKAYQHIDRRDPVVVANKLTKCLYFIGSPENISFTNEQDVLITQLSQIGQHAGLNGSYRAWYGDKGQF